MATLTGVSLENLSRKGKLYTIRELEERFYNGNHKQETKTLTSIADSIKCLPILASSVYFYFMYAD